MLAYEVNKPGHILKVMLKNFVNEFIHRYGDTIFQILLTDVGAKKV